MTSSDLGDLLALAAAALALLLVRGIGACFEAALVAVGSPRAQERARLEEMCKKLLANTVIEDYRIEL